MELATTMRMMMALRNRKFIMVIIIKFIKGEKAMFNKPKKLEKISYDTVSYIQIETEAIRDFNDKHMISSYCLHKLELVNWYIELIRVGSEKYIVPQSLSELEDIKVQLKACHEQIMKKKITPPNERPYIDIKYPKGYEG